MALLVRFLGEIAAPDWNILLLFVLAATPMFADSGLDGMRDDRAAEETFAPFFCVAFESSPPTKSIYYIIK